MFQFPAFAPTTLVTGLQPAGLPHSDISGSIPVCRSPELFAAYHVLPRFRKPRHPPFALILFLVLISESFATFTSQILLVLPLKLQSLFSQLEKTRILLLQTLISNFFTSLSLSVLSRISQIPSLKFPSSKGTAKVRTFFELPNFFQKIFKIFIASPIPRTAR